MHKVIIVLAAICMVGCASAPKKEKAPDTKAKTSTSKTKEPAWVSNPRSVYPENQYISAVGSGDTREAAEKNALGALISIFGQTVKGDTTVSSKYSEAVKSGKIAVSQDTNIDEAINTSFDLKSVVGAEIKDTWFDKKSTTYAVAVMDKMKASLVYSGLIESNEQTIAKLVAIPDTEKDTLDAYARYDLASAIGDANGQFVNVLSVLNPSAAAAKRGTVSSGDQLRIETLKIAQKIPISVAIEDDRDGRITAAFSAAIAKAGFKSGGVDSRYQLDGKFALSEAVLPNNTNKFARFLVDARLTDTLLSTVLLPYTINGREGHATMFEAENRAVRAAETKIAEDFGQKFSGYLNQLSSK